MSAPASLRKFRRRRNFMLSAPLLVEAYPNCRGPGKGRPWITLVRPVAAAWGHAVSPCLRCLPLSRRFVIFPGRSSIPGGRCSQGGVEIPTGGKGDVARARERLLFSREEGSADSVRFRSRRYSPDGRRLSIHRDSLYLVARRQQGGWSTDRAICNALLMSPSQASPS